MKLLVILSIAAVVFADDSMEASCEYCRSQIESLTVQIQENPPTLQQMGVAASQGCPQVTNAQIRDACFTTIDDNFGDVFAKFSTLPGDSASDYCINMGYC